MLNHCDESLDDLVKETQRLMKQVGFCLTEEESEQPADRSESPTN
jgi:hypothetical protein